MIKDFLNRLKIIRKDKRGVLIDTLEALQVADILAYRKLGDLFNVLFSRRYGILSCSAEAFSVSYNSNQYKVKKGVALVPFDMRLLSPNYWAPYPQHNVISVPFELSSDINDLNPNGEYLTDDQGYKYIGIFFEVEPSEYSKEVIMKDSHSASPQEDIPGIANYKIKVGFVPKDGNKYYVQENSKFIRYKKLPNCDNCAIGFIIAKVNLNNIIDFRNDLFIDFNQDIFALSKCTDVERIIDTYENTLDALLCEIINLETIVMMLVARIQQIEQCCNLGPLPFNLDEINTCNIIIPEVTEEIFSVIDNNPSLDEGTIQIVHKIKTNGNIGPSFSIIKRRIFGSNNPQDWKTIKWVPFKFNNQNGYWEAIYYDKVDMTTAPYGNPCPTNCGDYEYKAQYTVGVSPVGPETNTRKAIYKPKKIINPRITTSGGNVYIVWDSMASYNIEVIEVFKGNNFISSLPKTATQINITPHGYGTYTIVTTRANGSRRSYVNVNYSEGASPS
ncbi:MAG: hypothetical protein ACO2O4_05080 [Minisyncoccia bacterium]|jgi:hypothetical protein